MVKPLRQKLATLRHVRRIASSPFGLNGLHVPKTVTEALTQFNEMHIRYSIFTKIHTQFMLMNVFVWRGRCYGVKVLQTSQALFLTSTNSILQSLAWGWRIGLCLHSAFSGPLPCLCLCALLHCERMACVFWGLLLIVSFLSALTLYSCLFRFATDVPPGLLGLI